MTMTNQAALLARRDILDSFLSFAAELDHHRRAVARLGGTRRAMDAVEGRAETPADADGSSSAGTEQATESMAGFPS